MSSPVDHGVDEDFKKLKINRQQKSGCSTSDEDWIKNERSTDHGGCESHQSQPLRHDVEEVKVDYDSMLKNESPQSTVLKIVTIALEKALQELPEYLQSTRECSLSMLTRNKIVRCKTPEPALFLHKRGPSIPSISEPLTPLQKFKEKTPHIQMTLVKEYLTVLNTATEEELLQLKGIGPKRAARVLELRQQCQDPFNDLQDLKDIGIGKRERMSEFAKTMM